MRLLHINIQHHGPLSDEQVSALDRMSILICSAPGFVWKTFTKSRLTGNALGIYVFQDERTAKNYSRCFFRQMSELGIAEIKSEINQLESGLHTDMSGDPVNLFFSPSQDHWHMDAMDDMAA